MNLATKKIVAKEVLIFTVSIIISLIIYGIWYAFLSPDTRVHPGTGEVLIIKSGIMDEKFVLKAVVTLLLIAYPIRFFYYMIQWAIKILKEPTTA